MAVAAAVARSSEIDQLAPAQFALYRLVRQLYAAPQASSAGDAELIVGGGAAERRQQVDRSPMEALPATRNAPLAQQPSRLQAATSKAA